MSAIRKLDFSRVQIHGRSSELSTMMEAYERSQSSSEVILVSGMGGSGKSSLVQAFLTRMARRHALCSSGKFDQLQSDGISTVVDAFSGICHQILADEEFVANLRPTMRVALGREEVHALSSIIPSIYELMDWEDPPPHRNNNQERRDDVGCPWNLVLLRHQLKVLLKVICQNDHRPIVLVLEDLHWADKASIDLLLSLVERNEMSGILFVGVYRDAEVTLSHPFSKCLFVLHYTRVHVENLEPNDIAQIISDVSRSDAEDCLTLGEIVHAKTSGCALSVVHFLRMIESRRFVSFSFTKGAFQWDLAKILSDMHTILAEGMEDMFSQRTVLDHPRASQCGILHRVSFRSSCHRLDSLGPGKARAL